MVEKNFDVVVIGGGPGGYPAAIALAQNGKKVALIEKDKVGGTCLHRGCIPTKALLTSAEAFSFTKKAKDFGIQIEKSSFDWNTIYDQKNGIVKGLFESLEKLIGLHGVTLIKGTGKLLGPTKVEVTGKESCTISCKHIILATGSEPREFAAFPFDGEKIHSSTSILDIKKIPKRFVVIGGGAVGVEFASIFNAFGSQVTIIEALDRILPFECETVSKALTNAFEKQNIKIIIKSPVDAVTKDANGVRVLLKDQKTIEADCCLVSVGRSYNVANIGLEAAGVKVEKGFIPVSNTLQTNVKNIYAIGDVNARSLYAHAATHQGQYVAAQILGSDFYFSEKATPSVVFTDPQVATCGLSLDAALKAKLQAKRASYQFIGLAKARALRQTEGFAQIVYDETTEAILGAQVVGHDAANLIAPMTFAINNEYTLDAICDTMFAHPTLQEIWHEAALIAKKRPLHALPVKL